jgi:hypothetical protein
VVARHRAAPLAADGLRRAGLVVPEPVAAAAASDARRALDLAGETLRVHQAFLAAGTDVLFVKGSTLAQLAYGDLGMKQSSDIDLLLAEEDVLAGYGVLRALGYRLSRPVPSEAELPRYIPLAKECTLYNQELGFAVDLHWRLTDNEDLLDSVGMESPRQEVAIGSRSLPTLADAPLFAYLCVHGTVHAWTRLKWLADLAAFVGRKDAPEVAGLYREAELLGAGRAPAVALLLSRHLFDLPLEPGVERSAGELRGAKALAVTALEGMAQGGGTREVSHASFAGLRVIRSHFAIAPGLGFAWRHLVHLWMAAPERARIALPDWLGFVYHVLRVPMFLGRRCKGLVARLRT